MQVKEGSLWGSSDHKKFRVLHIIEQDNKTWVHYRNEDGKAPDPKEYSCYLESFLQRFRQMPE